MENIYDYILRVVDIKYLSIEPNKSFGITKKSFIIHLNDGKFRLDKTLDDMWAIMDDYGHIQKSYNLGHLVVSYLKDNKYKYGGIR